MSKDKKEILKFLKEFIYNSCLPILDNGLPIFTYRTLHRTDSKFIKTFFHPMDQRTDTVDKYLDFMMELNRYNFSRYHKTYLEFGNLDDRLRLNRNLMLQHFFKSKFKSGVHEIKIDDFKNNFMNFESSILKEF